MSVSGLVVTLADDPQRAEAARQVLLSAGVFTFGEPVGQRLPMVLDAASSEDSRRWHEWLVGVEGVAQVDIAFVSLEEDEDDQ